jgi:hypothetical protein
MSSISTVRKDPIKDPGEFLFDYCARQSYSRHTGTAYTFNKFFAFCILDFFILAFCINRLDQYFNPNPGSHVL